MNLNSQATVEGLFQYLIYSPRGEIEGVLLEANGEPLQLVFEKHDGESPVPFMALETGRRVVVEAEPQGPSPKGDSAHPVHAFGRLVSIDGKKPAAQKAASGPAYQGTVVRFNYARHGEANGVVLDSGDFIHTRPDGMARLKLKIGDRVRADGDAHRLADDAGWAVEATVVNGKPVKPH